MALRKLCAAAIYVEDLLRANAYSTVSYENACRLIFYALVD
jgi:hypothetical protein